MSKLDLINSLYSPMQPTIRQSDDNVSYEEKKPERVLDGIVHCYWQLKTSRPLDKPFTYRVVADGCIDIFFDMTATNESFVMGFCQKYTEFPLENNFNYVGIRFFPSMFPQLFKISAKEISNNVFELEEIVPTMASFIKNSVNASMGLPQIAFLLNSHLKKIVSNIQLNLDNRFYGAVYLILKNKGVLETERDLDTGISPRQLRRVFDYYIGTSPKTFSKVIQFQNILCAKPSVQSLKKNKIFYDVGYSDQAHFIRDFKNFYGITPNRAFK